MTEQTETRSPRYPVRINLTDPRSVYTHLFELIPAGASILDVGGAAGDLEVLVRSRGCRSTVIEADPVDALKAAEVSDRVIVGNVETIDLGRHLADERFDVIVFADVLEHLREPLTALGRLKDFLRPGGRVLASIPNVAHGALRLSLLAGRWEYTPTGLLDRTHIRFFTRATIEQTFEAAGLRLDELRCIEINPFGTEIRLDRSAYPPGLIEWVEREPEALTYQFIVKATPVGACTASGSGGGSSDGPESGEPRGAGGTGPSARDLADARRLALERLEVEAAARELDLQRRVWQLEQEALELRRLAAEGEAAKGELRLIKESGSYRLARVLARVRWAMRRGRGGGTPTSPSGDSPAG